MAFMKKYRLHYAWVILAAACVLSIVSRADSASFAVFIDPLVAQFGWKRGDISFAYALAFLAGMPAVVIMGWLGDRYGARKLMIGSSLLISAGTVLLGTIKELWQFYVFGVLEVLMQFTATILGTAYDQAINSDLLQDLFRQMGDLRRVMRHTR
ncbi:MAG: MFS transporter [Burkholderiales bacterium]|nr:MFS transporter [Burkholderiales bacterium]